VGHPGDITQSSGRHDANLLRRRTILKGLLGLSCALPLSSVTVFARGQSDDEFLEDLSRRSFQFFLDHTGSSGIVRDRARTDGKASGPHEAVGSIAATGFGLTALCIAAERGWLPRAEARERVRRTLATFARQATAHGWFHHFLDIHTGERIWNSEVSSIDTALLLAGVLTAKQAWEGDGEIRELASTIVGRVDYQWMLDGHPTLLSHGWYPETGFIQHRWDDYSELMILYLLGLGASNSPLPEASWRAWRRPAVEYAGIKYVGREALFVHQFAHAWVDFRGWRDPEAPHDWHENSVRATRAHRQFCFDIGREFPGSYDEPIWGITASDTRAGYKALSGPPRTPGIDGTVVPCAPGGSLMFTPDITISALRAMKDRFGDRIYGRYGFADAFHPGNGWVNPDVIGIDLGITLLAAENLRSGAVWQWFMRNDDISRGLKRAGLSTTAAAAA
jgi:hypothetical protein